MPRGVNDYESTYELAGALYCNCGHLFRAEKFRWRGEKELRCSLSCLMITALKEDMQELQTA